MRIPLFTLVVLEVFVVALGIASHSTGGRLLFFGIALGLIVYDFKQRMRQAEVELRGEVLSVLRDRNDWFSDAELSRHITERRYSAKLAEGKPVARSEKQLERLTPDRAALNKVLKDLLKERVADRRLCELPKEDRTDPNVRSGYAWRLIGTNVYVGPWGARSGIGAA